MLIVTCALSMRICILYDQTPSREKGSGQMRIGPVSSCTVPYSTRQSDSSKLVTWDTGPIPIYTHLTRPLLATLFA